MMLCICQSILVQSETNIVSNEWLHYLFERFPWFGAVWYNVSIPWVVESSVKNIKVNAWLKPVSILMWHLRFANWGGINGSCPDMTPPFFVLLWHHQFMCFMLVFAAFKILFIQNINSTCLMTQNFCPINFGVGWRITLQSLAGGW